MKRYIILYRLKRNVDAFFVTYDLSAAQEMYAKLEKDKDVREASFYHGHAIHSFTKNLNRRMAI